MANQMIALQARGPQLPNLGAAAAQYGNMMANMAVMKEKQAGIQRANAFRQLVSDPGFDPANPEHIKVAASLNPEGAEQIARSFDARRKSQQDYTMVEVERLRDIGAAVGDEAGYQDWLARVEKVSPGDAAAFRQFSPNFDPDKMSRIIMEADQYINKTIATPTASVQVSPTGTLQAVTVGGLGEPSAKEIPEYRYVPDQPPPAAGAAPAAAPVSGAPARATRGSATTPQDLLDQGVDPRSIPMGNLFQPMSFGNEGMGAGAIQPLTMETAPQIIQTAVQNGVIDQSHVEQLRQMVGPENDQALANWMRQNNVRIQPTGAPSMRTAVYRQPAVDYFAPQTDDGGMPFGGPAAALRQNIGYEPTGRAAQAKPPLQSPMPGSAIVPLPRVRGEAEATEAGKERATRLEKLRGALPTARAEAQSVVDDLAGRIKAIDDFLRYPYRSSVIGPIGGNVPRLLQFNETAEAQKLLDTITNNTVLQKILDSRAQTTTGGSPVGNMSNADLQFMINASTRIAQTGTQPGLERELQSLRDGLYRKFILAQRTFSDTFREIAPETPELARLDVPYVAPKYTPYTSQPTQRDIEALLRNRNDKRYVEGFRRHFGAAAFNRAIGGR